MIKRFVIAIILLGAVFGGLAWFNMFRDQMIRQAFAPKDPPPVTVASARAMSESWPRQIEAVGTLQAIQTVDVAPQVSGIVSEIAFEAGQRVKKGDVLVRLDVSVEAADLKRLEAVRRMSQLTFDRARQLNEKQFSSQATLDQAKATLETSEADMARIRALMDQKVIRAPFSGMLGVRVVNLGQYVGPGTKLVGLQALDSLYANLTLPEKRLADVKVGQTIAIKVDTFRDRDFSGKITTIDPQLDQANRMVLVQATVDNAELLLRPGMFASATISLDRIERLVVVPKTAIDFSLYGDSVYVLVDGTDAAGGAIKRVERRAVSVGDQKSGLISIVKGLREGEEVVTAGQVKLQNNVPVLVDNSIALRQGAAEPLR
ncbi:MAG: efflux RND transporter periplasmic adaptor subunit [Alphaproteobacteria bacterium]|nr:efflux RND transporter periplasmic adaptor subunit [Alphaproteobacteria bacterium]